MEQSGKFRVNHCFLLRDRRTNLHEFGQRGGCVHDGAHFGPRNSRVDVRPCILFSQHTTRRICLFSAATLELTTNNSEDTTTSYFPLTPLESAHNFVWVSLRATRHAQLRPVLSAAPRPVFCEQAIASRMSHRRREAYAGREAPPEPTASSLPTSARVENGPCADDVRIWIALSVFVAFSRADYIYALVTRT